jgi:hypothetical protein
MPRTHFSKTTATQRFHKQVSKRMALVTYSRLVIVGKPLASAAPFVSPTRCEVSIAIPQGARSCHLTQACAVEVAR